MSNSYALSFIIVSQVLAQEKQAKKAEKAAPHCRICKNPMKGHKNVKDCPKNN